MKYKKGDRVKVYGYTERTEADHQFPEGDSIHYLAYRRGAVGKVLCAMGDSLWVELDERGGVEVHPKQCRKLKKARK